MALWREPGVWKQLRSGERLASVDVFRGLAIVAVVLFHFEWLPYGYLGVDLFFVVSGLLVSRFLIADWRAERRVQPLRFIVMRGFKIWPSYYAMILFGSLFARVAYATSRPQEIVTLRHLPRYLLFFQNYRGTDHWSFDHVWSLCVEEHFYVILPILFFVVQAFSKDWRKLAAAVGLVVAAGVGFKVVGYRIGFETYAATHNRIDALSWGVLLSLVREFRPGLLAPLQKGPAALLLGIAVLAGSIYLHHTGRSPSFNAIGLHSLVPFSFFLMLACTYEWDLRAWMPLRFIAYYSYNWYLWHAVLAHAVGDRVGKGALGLAIYLAATFGAAFVFTTYLEEPVLLRRRRVLDRLFPQRASAVAVPAAPDP